MNEAFESGSWMTGGVAPTACTAVLAAGLCALPTQEGTVAICPDAAYVNEAFDNAMETGAACYVRSGALRIRESLQWLTRKYCVGNWNGYGERAISAKSWEAAYRFAQTLPDWVAGAEAVVDADGEVSIEWYVSNDCYLELSFAESGNVHCYFKAPDCKCSDIFASKEDKRILELVARMSHV